MLPWSADLAGRIDEHVITSELLRANPLGDPCERPLLGLPAAGVRRRSRPFLPGGLCDPGLHRPCHDVAQPVGLPAAVPRDRGRRVRGRARPRRRSSSTSTRGPPTAAASSSTRPAPAGTTPTSATRSCPGWTGGTGRWPRPGHRAIMGKSSGGFGAMITPMLRPDLFGALATHAGDSLYELCYVPEFGKDVRHLRDVRRGHLALVGRLPVARPSFTKEADHDLLMLLGVAACFSAEPDGTVELPFDPQHRGAPAARSGSAGWTGTRSGWSRATPTSCGRCGRSGSTPGRRDDWFLDVGARGVPGGAAARQACPTR